MDTARYSVAQSYPKNIFGTTVFKALPPLFPIPRGGKKSGEDVQQYEDGTTERVLDEKYFGTERRKAFARFAELKHQRPGIETHQDTDRRPWER